MGKLSAGGFEMIIHKVSEHQEVFYVLGDYEQVFLGQVYGIGLVHRGLHDPHVCFVILGGDDGYWQPNNTGNSSSSSWFSDIRDVITRAEEWCKAHCTPHMHDGRQYGWEFLREAEK
jgi:hypothetical protein